MKAARYAGGTWLVAMFLGLSEGQVLLDSPNLGGVHQSGFAQSALALAGLLLENVTLTLLAAQDLARAGHLETLGNSLTCLVDTTFAGHGAGIIHTFSPLARKISGSSSLFFEIFSIASASLSLWRFLCPEMKNPLDFPRRML